MRILIVEDDDVAAELIANALVQAGYDVTTANNGCKALELIRSGLYRLVVSDWEMPEMTGVELCREVRLRHSSAYIYFILLTSRSGPQNVIEGLNAGADDFVTKPFHPQELFVRVRVGERILSLEGRDLTIFSLAKLAESRDPETGAHLERMREYCRVLAEHLSQQERFCDTVDGEFVQLLYLTSPLHDIGKVGIPDRILLKPDHLTADEFEIMKQHSVIGFETLDAASRAFPEAEYLQMARDIALSHHEKFNGSGYPYGLVEKEIPLCARIVAVADVYDAITTKRVYKEAYSHEAARSIILEGKGEHFDPDIVDAFVETEEQFLAIKENFNSPEANLLSPQQLCHA